MACYGPFHSLAMQLPWKPEIPRESQESLPEIPPESSDQSGSHPAGQAGSIAEQATW